MSGKGVVGIAGIAGIAAAAAAAAVVGIGVEIAPAAVAVSVSAGVAEVAEEALWECPEIGRSHPGCGIWLFVVVGGCGWLLLPLLWLLLLLLLLSYKIIPKIN